MKRAGLLRTSKFLLVLSLTLFGVHGVNPQIAEAATIGSGKCSQTVDSSVDVAVTESGNYCYVAFKAGSRTWSTPTNVSTIDFLIVAGGGSGGSRHAGGGGAGGLLRGASVSISGVTALNISVGAGAPAPSRVSGNNFTLGEKGTDSFLSKNSGSGGFTSRTAIGGGGGTAAGLAPQYGGSGGGSQSSTVSTFESGQGNAGGTGGFSAGYWYAAGGGGGAGGVGLNHTSTSGGAGGPGAIWINDFTTTIATSLGLPQTRQVSGNQVYFAGGGGGSTTSTTPGEGGLGGGGAAVLGNNTGVSGGVNSGGGGGGSGCCDGGTPGAGGSGVVILRYILPSFTNATTFSIAENSATSTNAATITLTESATVTIRNLGDSTFFNVISSDSITARIRFINSPDCEAFADAGGNSEYDITVRATNTSGNYQELAIKITVTDVLESAVIATPTFSAAAYKGRSITISVTVSTPGKVRFFVAGKRVPNCLSKPTSGTYPNYSASCAWTPALSGNQLVRATVTPTNNAIGAVTSDNSPIYIFKRTNNR